VPRSLPLRGTVMYPPRGIDHTHATALHISQTPRKQSRRSKSESLAPSLPARSRCTSVTSASALPTPLRHVRTQSGWLSTRGSSGRTLSNW